jgi:hypothetical protein
MQAKSAAYFTALTADAVEWRYGMDILAADEGTPLEDSSALDLNASDRLIAQSGQIDLDTSAKAHRAFKLALRSNDGRYLPGPKGFASGGAGSPAATGLAWYNVRYRPWIDLRTGFDGAGNKVYDRTYLGMFALTQPEVQVQAASTQVTLSLVDKANLLMKPYLMLPSNMHTFSKGGHTVSGYASGTSFDSAMSDLATRAGIPVAKQLFESSPVNLPADWTIVEGDEPWTHLLNMAGSIAHVLYFDHLGNLRRRAHPLSVNAVSAYNFIPGPTCTISQLKRTVDLTNTFNHVIVIGANSKGALVRGEALITDTTSPYHKNNVGERVTYVGKDGKLGDQTPDPAISTVALARSRAQAVLAQHLGRQETIQIATRNIPPLEPYDRFTVSVPQSGLNMDFFADKISWKLAHDGMTIDASRWVSASSLGVL